MTYATIELLKDIIIFITITHETYSDRFVDYYDFTDWTDINLTRPEVREAYTWLINNKYVTEWASHPNSDESPYCIIRANEKAWKWAKDHNVNRY